MAEPVNKPNEVLPALCAVGLQAELLTGYFRDFLIRRFNDQNHLQRESVRSLLWQAAPITNILIESISRWDPKLTQKRPGIIVKRNDYRNYRVGLGDFFGANQEGNDLHSTFWVGSHTIFCIRDEGQAADLLAAEVRDHLLELGPVIRHDLQLQQYQVLQVGAQARIVGDQNIQSRVVPIVVGWAYEHSWTVEQEVPRVRRISLSMLLDLPSSNS